ncbi:MAG TPA: 1,2-phenylacetyl-CoA epoxidase subunit PaaA [Deinococcales bacterium]|nr:1,2-phenylacetyl-CoA epoxidase subunit PaaA [Deinococcales bacterium]
MLHIDPSWHDDQKLAAFQAHIEQGGQVEATDWMPDEYRNRVLRFVEMHANSEIMGALPERDWILRAPTLKRKLALTAKIQDEVGHGHLLYRLAEDLGKSREAMLEDLIAGKTKFHNVFHYPTFSWGDVGVIAWLVDAAAILSQSALLRSSYAPYARTMKRICWEEAFHLKQGEDIVLSLAGGTPAQKAMVQEALNRWWMPLMMFHGPATPPEKDGDLKWRIKGKHNEELRQEFLHTYVPKILEIGLTIPDPKLRFDEASGLWDYTRPDWTELYSVVTGHGPRSQERLAQRRLAWEESQWVRDAILGRHPVPAAAD